MWRVCLLIGIAFILLVTSCDGVHSKTSNGSTQTIALDQIWALAIPGTHDIRELEPEKFGERIRTLSSEEQARLFQDSKMLQLQVALEKGKPSAGEDARPGFAVLGTGREALDGACDVLVNGQKPDDSFPFGSNVTLVFFSHRCAQYVQLVNVERRDKTFEIKYRLVSSTLDFTGHVALIPAGKLPTGKYQVEIIQMPGGKDSTGRITGGLPPDKAAQVVCRSFSFSIANREGNQ
jgi:hypothetical protein